MKSLVIAFFMLLAGPVFAQVHAFGMHLTTYHTPNISCGNGKNPGIYLRTSSGFVGGMYHNSCERQSEYLGYLTPEWNNISIQFAAVTGYARPITPLAFPSLRMSVHDDLSARVSGASRAGRTVVHLSVERRF